MAGAGSGLIREALELDTAYGAPKAFETPWVIPEQTQPQTARLPADPAKPPPKAPRQQR